VKMISESRVSVTPCATIGTHRLRPLPRYRIPSHDSPSGVWYTRWIRALRGVPGCDLTLNLSATEFFTRQRSQGFSWSHAASSKKLLKTLTRE